jgi:hypothetical protein
MVESPERIGPGHDVNETELLDVTVRNRRSRRHGSIEDLKVDLVSPQLNSMGRDGLNRRHAKSFAVADIKPCAVPGTLDLHPVELPFRQWTAIVSANVVNRVEGVSHVKQRDGPAIDLEKSFAPRRNL